jgi:hypothetical protein
MSEDFTGSKMRNLFKKISGLMAVVTLVACGGGGGIDSGTEPLSVSATEVTATGAVAQVCATGDGPILYIYGGAWPYSLLNPYPEGLILSSNQVTEPSGGVRLSFTGRCFKTLSLVILDRAGKSLTVAVTNQPPPVDEPASAPAP